jgi:RNA-directed DNA polymerase
MAAQATVAGAAPDETRSWHTIPWGRVLRNVRRLQVRIVKAFQAGRHGKVHALRHLLAHSFAGKALAVLRVATNRGAKTPGCDGSTWSSPEDKQQAIQALRTRGYRARPLRRLYIPKSNGQQRPLGIPTLHDRAMQALYALTLDPLAESRADPNSYGFRRERCCADALEQCHKVLGAPHSSRWLLEADLRSCFDRISHSWLLDHVPLPRGVLSQWLRCGYLENDVLHDTTEGTPQGGIISPLLMNWTLDGLETLLNERLMATSRQRFRNKVHLVRYADDFVITGSSPQLLHHEVRPLVERFLRPRGLELHPEKTSITHSEDGCDFLGQTIKRHASDKVLLTPSRKSVRRLRDKVRDLLRRSGAWTAGELIAALNPLLRGWACYHRHSSSSRTFASIERWLFARIWRWARKRHPSRSATWVKEKYYHGRGGRRWVFYGVLPNRDGVAEPISLVQLTTLTLRKHVKIRGAAHPYDPAWEPYFEERLLWKVADPELVQRDARLLWEFQDGKCPVCAAVLDLESGWELHHVQWRVHGGSDTLDNLALLHAHCHRQVHSR